MTDGHGDEVQSYRFSSHLVQPSAATFNGNTAIRPTKRVAPSDNEPENEPSNSRLGIEGKSPPQAGTQSVRSMQNPQDPLRRSNTLCQVYFSGRSGQMRLSRASPQVVLFKRVCQEHDGSLFSLLFLLLPALPLLLSDLSANYRTRHHRAYDSLSESLKDTASILNTLFPNHTVASLAPLSRQALIKLLDCQTASPRSELVGPSPSSVLPAPSQHTHSCQQPIPDQQTWASQPLMTGYHAASEPPHLSDDPSPPSERSFGCWCPACQEASFVPTEGIWFAGFGYSLSEYTKPCGCTPVRWPGPSVSCYSADYEGSAAATANVQHRC